MSTALPTCYGLHVYPPLARAWKMGASTWTVDKRIQFANDIDRNLMAVDGPTNGKKSDKGLDEWMPPQYGVRMRVCGTLFDSRPRLRVERHHR